MESGFPSKPYKIHGGANVPHHKNTSRLPSVTMPAPKQVVIPMQQHAGAPCTPLVKKGTTSIADKKSATAVPLSARRFMQASPAPSRRSSR